MFDLKPKKALERKRMKKTDKSFKIQEKCRKFVERIVLCVIQTTFQNQWQFMEKLRHRRF